MKNEEYSEFLQTLHIWIIQEFFLPKRFIEFMESGQDGAWTKGLMLNIADVAGWTYNSLGLLKAKSIKISSLL